LKSSVTSFEIINIADTAETGVQSMLLEKEYLPATFIIIPSGGI